MTEAFNYESINEDFVLSLQSVQLEEKGTLPSDAGIYIVYQTVPKVIVLYVGKSQCFTDRFANHELVGLFTLFNYVGNGVRIAYLPLEVATDDNLTLNEMIVIHKLQPLLNVEHNPKRPIFMKPIQVDKIGYNVVGIPTKRRCPKKREKAKIAVELVVSGQAGDILKEIHVMTIRQLKKTASRVGVTGYNLMTKNDLIDAITSLLNSVDKTKLKESSAIYLVNRPTA